MFNLTDFWNEAKAAVLMIVISAALTYGFCLLMFATGIFTIYSGSIWLCSVVAGVIFWPFFLYFGDRAVTIYREETAS